MGDENRIFPRVKSRKGKDLNIFVGLLYTVSSKSIGDGFMTYENEARKETANLLEIAWHNPEDYEHGGISRDNALWTILPAEDGENNYVLKVLGFSEGILTYSHGLSWGGRYMELDLQNPKYYEPGGTMHSSGLWNFDSSEFFDHVTVHNSDARRNPNFVTFSNEQSANGQLMQIATKDIPSYEPKGIFRQDALWNFKADYVLSAVISNFKYDIPSENDLLEYSYRTKVVDEIIVNDTEEPLEEISSEKILEEFFDCSFLNSFKMFHPNNISIQCDVLKHFPIPQGKLNFVKHSNTLWTAERNRKLEFNAPIQVPPAKSVKVDGCCQWVEKLEIPFTAVVNITAVAAVCVPTNTHEFKEKSLQIKDANVIEYFLKYERFSGKIVKNKKMDTGVVQCSVSGILKCSFPFLPTVDATIIAQN